MSTLHTNNQETISYEIFGNKNGKPIFICHGLNSSRLEALLLEELLSQNKIMIFSIDRPGIGKSSYKKNRKVLDFVDTLVQVADELQVDKFSVMGISAGAAYALACTYKIPHRLISAHIISGLGPIDEHFSSLNPATQHFVTFAKTFPWLLEVLFWFLFGRHSQNMKKEETFIKNITASLHEVDKNVFTNSKTKELFLQSAREAYSSGSKGVAYDAKLAYATPWEFNVSDITFENIYLYNGCLDLSIPISMAVSLNNTLRGSSLRLYANDGHISVLINHMNKIEEDILNNFSIYEE